MIRCLNCGREAKSDITDRAIVVRCCEAVAIVSRGGFEVMTQDDYDRRIEALRRAHYKRVDANQPWRQQG